MGVPAILERACPLGVRMPQVQDHDWSLARRRGGLVASVVMGVLALLSAFHLNGPPWSIRWEVTTTTVLFVALAGVPWLLERVVDRGGSVRLPGGVEVAMDSRELREVGLPGLAATEHEVGARLRRLEREYERWRGTAATWGRTQHLERILAEARLLAGAASELIIGRLGEFDGASDGARAVTVGLVEGAVAAPGKTASTLTSGLRATRSAFEAYHLLKAVELHLGRFTPQEQQTLRDLIAAKVEDGSLPPGTDRWDLARRILGTAAE